MPRSKSIEKRALSVRWPVDLLEAAAVEGERHERSKAQQLVYWARLGQLIEQETGTTFDRINDELGRSDQFAS